MILKASLRQKFEAREYESRNPVMKLRTDLAAFCSAAARCFHGIADQAEASSSRPQ